MIDKHFNKYNIIHEILNRKVLKISFSCTKKSFKIINSHNNEKFGKYYDQMNNNNNNTSKENDCNCKIKINCLMKGLCYLENVVFEVIIFSKIKNKKIYISEFHRRDGN